MSDSSSTQSGAWRIVDHPSLGPSRERDRVRIYVDGQAIVAHAGEPIAAAMLAHGLLQTRTMPESGQTRGVFCGVGRCPDCSMIVDGVPNVRTCMTQVHEGQVVETQPGVGASKILT